MTNPNFNLIEDGWIPVQGEIHLQSLRDVFSRRELLQLGGNPVEKIVMLRLLLSIAHAAVELPDRKTWRELTPDRLAKKALAYLEEWHDRFDLYGETPFLQFPALAKGKVSPIINALAEVSSGNTPILTSWNIPLAEADYGDAFKVRILLWQSCFGCSGKCYDQKIRLDGREKKATARSGTLIGYQGYLHSYLLGDTLWETVRNNLLCADEIAEYNVFTGGIGRPFWENMPVSETCSRATELLSTYQGQLFPLDKFLLLKDGGIVMTDGIAYPTHKTGLADPALTLWTDGKEGRALWCNTEKKPWRELVALLGFIDAQQGRQTPWFLCRGLAGLAKTDAAAMTFWTGGMRVSYNAGEQYLSGTDDYVESVFRVSVSDSATRFQVFKSLIETLDDYARRLYAAVNGYFKALQSAQGAAIAPVATMKFWELLEQRSQHIVDIAFGSDAGREEAIAAEQKVWRQTVLQIYNGTCPNVTARQLTAWVKSTPNFNSKKKEDKKNGK